MRPLVVLVVLLTAGCGAPFASHHLTSTRCADLVLLGLRGQGQSSHAHHGVGQEVDGVVGALSDRLHGHTSVRLQAVSYPARPAPTLAALDADVATGVRLVRRAATSVRATCPRTRLGLVGFSEGAQVAHQAATRGTWAVVVLLGDPVRNPADDVRTLSFGRSPAGHGRNGTGPRFPATTRTRVVEACVATDNVCNAAAGGGAISAAHRDFYERSATARLLGRVSASVVASMGLGSR